KSNPRAVAEQIKSKLDLGHIASDISIAGPGFINVRLNPAWIAEQLALPDEDSKRAGERVVIDYSGPNIAKELHIGHFRATIIGDALARILEFQGNDVIRQNHVGDWGTQFGMLIAFVQSARTTPPEEALVVFPTITISDLEDFYRDARKLF